MIAVEIIQNKTKIYSVCISLCYQVLFSVKMDTALYYKLKRIEKMKYRQHACQISNLPPDIKCGFRGLTIGELKAHEKKHAESIIKNKRTKARHYEIPAMYGSIQDVSGIVPDIGAEVSYQENPDCDQDLSQFLCPLDEISYQSINETATNDEPTNQTICESNNERSIFHDHNYVPCAIFSINFHENLNLLVNVATSIHSQNQTTSEYLSNSETHDLEKINIIQKDTISETTSSDNKHSTDILPIHSEKQTICKIVPIDEKMERGYGGSVTDSTDAIVSFFSHDDGVMPESLADLVNNDVNLNVTQPNATPP